MRIWKLVSGLISICVGLYVFFVAQVAGAFASLLSDFNSTPYTLAAFAVLCGGICSIVSRNEEKLETLITIGCYGVAFPLILIAAIMNGGTGWQLVMCIIWCLVCAVVSAGTYYLNMRGMTVQDLVKAIQARQPKPQQGPYPPQGGFNQQQGYGQPGQPWQQGQPMQPGQPWQQQPQAPQQSMQPQQPIQSQPIQPQPQQFNVQQPMQPQGQPQPMDEGYDFFSEGEDDF